MSAVRPEGAAPDHPEDDPPSEAPVRKKKDGFRNLVEWVVIIGGAFLVAFVVKTFLIQAFFIPSGSMLPTLHENDRVLVNKLSYDLHDPRHGDIVVLEDIRGSLEVRDLIKRVIALPGETIEYRDCQLFLNGQRMNEPYLDPALVRVGQCGPPQEPVEVEPGHVFVMGDNRDKSSDSRDPAIGQIASDDLIGRAFVVVWPTSRWRWL